MGRGMPYPRSSALNLAGYCTCGPGGWAFLAAVINRLGAAHVRQGVVIRVLEAHDLALPVVAQQIISLYDRNQFGGYNESISAAAVLFTNKNSLLLQYSRLASPCPN